MTAAIYIRILHILLFGTLYSKYVSANGRNYKKGVVFHEAQSCYALEPQKTSGWWYSWSVTDGFGSTNNFYKNKGSFCAAEDSAMAVEKARSEGMDFVPMFWRSIPDRPFEEVVHNNLAKSHYLLTFNEPEGETQAHLTSLEVAEMWPDIVDIAREYELQIVAPCTESGGRGKTWYEGWKQECERLYGDVGCKYDYICMHMYFHPHPCADGVKSWACVGENANAAAHILQSWYDSFGEKPIWVTEFACAPWGGHNCTEVHHTDLMKQLGSLLDESPLVYRYAWFSMYDNDWKTNSLNTLVWHGYKELGCENWKWKGAWGNSDWQIQTIDQCVSASESDDECHKPLSISIDNDNCFCGEDECSNFVRTWSGMTTYKKVGNESFADVTDIGVVYEGLGFPRSGPTYKKKPTNESNEISPVSVEQDTSPTSSKSNSILISVSLSLLLMPFLC